MEVFVRIEVLQNPYVAPAVLADDFLLGFQWLFPSLYGASQH